MGNIKVEDCFKKKNGAIEGIANGGKVFKQTVFPNFNANILDTNMTAKRHHPVLQANGLHYAEGYASNQQGKHFQHSESSSRKQMPQQGSMASIPGMPRSQQTATMGRSFWPPAVSLLPNEEGNDDFPAPSSGIDSNYQSARSMLDLYASPELSFERVAQSWREVKDKNMQQFTQH